eukprot:CCRYP_016249-RA/>CCRYP_016249-RA protein AED:0.29 eAED:0.29 QI:0/0/0.5/1/0/0.5/2/256/306
MLTSAETEASRAACLNQIKFDREEPIRESLHFSNNGNGSSQLLMDHESQNSHHSSTSLVELNCPFICLPLGALLVPSKVKSIAEVSPELRFSSGINHYPCLKETNESKSLEKGGSRDGIRAVDRSNTVGNISKRTVEFNVSWKVVTSSGDEVSDEGKLGNTSNISKEKFDEYRTAELKHGRAAMLAVLGYIAPETYRFGFDIAPGVSTYDIPNGVAAIDYIPALGWAQIIFLIGAVDYWGVLGDFSFGKPDLGDKEEERKLQELQHGRLAMLAFLELLRHDSQNFVSPGFDGYDKMITGLPFMYGN